MEKMWAKLNSGRTWYRADNEAYIYWNTVDSCWWIDKVTSSSSSCIVMTNDPVSSLTGWECTRPRRLTGRPRSKGGLLSVLKQRFYQNVSELSESL